jgi:hypothetical protein
LQELDFDNMSAEESELMEQLPQSKNNDSGKSPAPPIPRDAQKKAKTPNSQTQKPTSQKAQIPTKILTRINIPDFHLPKKVEQGI